jgi:hypothetical protein
MATKRNNSQDFELEVDSRELTTEELLEVNDFIRRDKLKNSNKLSTQKIYLKRKRSKTSKV